MKGLTIGTAIGLLLGMAGTAVPEIGEPKYQTGDAPQLEVPRSWGKVVGVGGGMKLGDDLILPFIYFEAPDGTIRQARGSSTIVRR